MIAVKNSLMGQRHLSIISQVEIFFKWGFQLSLFMEWESFDIVLVTISFCFQICGCTTEQRVEIYEVFLLMQLSLSNISAPY